MSRFGSLATACLLVASVGCGDEARSPLGADLEGSLPSAHLGLEVFVQECATCHASHDGFDLALFSFPDSTIIRRALGHVDMTAARNIVAHIESMDVTGFPRETNVFQPGARVLGSDREFAIELFGHDAWPADMTTAELLAIDPRDVSIALALPRWSLEEGNLDWMPDHPLVDAVLSYGQTEEMLRRYQLVQSDQNLLQAVHALRVSALDGRNPSAPCVERDFRVTDYETCFQTQRWIATIGAQHMFRTGTEDLHPVVHDAFWDIGQTARRAMLHGGIPFENGHANWATWMWLGWTFEPSRHASVYTGSGMQIFGLTRHATFMSLRSQVDRPARSRQPYNDLWNATRFAPGSWTTEVASFGLRHLIERLESGDVPTPHENETLDDLRNRVIRSVQRAVAIDPSSRDELEALGLRVLELMPEDTD